MQVTTPKGNLIEWIRLLPMVGAASQCLSMPLVDAGTRSQE